MQVGVTKSQVIPASINLNAEYLQDQVSVSVHVYIAKLLCQTYPFAEIKFASRTSRPLISTQLDLIRWQSTHSSQNRDAKSETKNKSRSGFLR